MSIYPYLPQAGKKDFDWARNSFDSIITQATQNVLGTNMFSLARNTNVDFGAYFYNKIYKYFLFHGSDTYFLDEFKHLTTKVFNVYDQETESSKQVEYAIPVPIRNLNYIKPIVLQLYGEQIPRPFNFTVQNTGRDAVKIKQEVELNFFIEQMNAKLKKELMEAGLPFDNPEKIDKALEDINTNVEEYKKMPYKDKYAQTMQSLLDYYYHRYNIKAMTDKAFLDLLIFNEEIFLVNLFNRQNPIQRISPLHCVYDINSYSDEAFDPSWFLCWDFLSLEECIARFNLTDEQVYTLDKDRQEGYLFNTQSYLDINLYNMYNQHYLHNKYIVYYGIWKAIGGLEAVKEDTYYIKNFGEYAEKRFKDLVLKKKKQPQQLHYQEIWHGVRIGKDTYIGLEPYPVQPRSEENLKHVRLPVSVIKLEGRSLVDDMKNVDFLLKILWHKVEYLLSQAKGKVVAYDLSHIPRNYNYDIDKVIYHLSTDGLLLYNSKEDGMINNGGNMIHEIDLGISQTLGQVVQMIQLLEKKLADIAGVNEQRMAQMQGKDSLGVTKAALEQSILRTEYLYRSHAISIKNLLTVLCNFAKLYHKNGHQSLYNKIGETKTEVLNIVGDNLQADFGIFINDTTKESLIFESIKMLAQMFIQQGMLDVKEYIYILESENLQIAKAKLQIAEQQKKLEAQEAQKSQQETEQKLLQMKQQHEKEIITINAQINKEASMIAEQSEMSRELEKLKIEQQKLEIEKEKLATERQRLETEINNQVANLKSQLELKEKELNSRITLEELKQNTDIYKLQIQQELERLLKELEINTKKELEYAKMQHEIDIETLRMTQNKNDIAYQQQLYELGLLKKQVEDYEQKLKQEAMMLAQYTKELDMKKDKLEAELDKLKDEKMKLETEKIKFNSEKNVQKEKEKISKAENKQNKEINTDSQYISLKDVLDEI